MKKATTILAAIVLFFASSAFAFEPDNVSAAVKEVFSKEFSKAENVTWKKTAEFYFAQFTLNQKTVTVAYNEKAELTGTSRMISASELPMNVGAALSKNYANYEISPSINEISLEGETYYYFTATNNKQILSVKGDSDGNFTVEKKIKK